MAPQVNACGLLLFKTILHSFKSQLYFTSQPVSIAVPTQASNTHLELPRTPNLLEPAPTTAFPISRATLTIGYTSQKPWSHSSFISRYIQNLTTSHQLRVHAELSPIISAWIFTGAAYQLSLFVTAKGNFSTYSTCLGEIKMECCYTSAG